jgi:hypothetical protein
MTRKKRKSNRQPSDRDELLESFARDEVRGLAQILSEFVDRPDEGVLLVRIKERFPGFGERKLSHAVFVLAALVTAIGTDEGVLLEDVQQLADSVHVVIAKGGVEPEAHFFFDGGPEPGVTPIHIN